MNSVEINGQMIPITYIKNPYKKRKITKHNIPHESLHRFRYVRFDEYEELLKDEKQNKIKIYFTRIGLKLALVKYYPLQI